MDIDGLFLSSIRLKPALNSSALTQKNDNMPFWQLSLFSHLLFKSIFGHLLVLLAVD